MARCSEVRYDNWVADKQQAFSGVRAGMKNIHEQNNTARNLDNTAIARGATRARTKVDDQVMVNEADSSLARGRMHAKLTYEDW